MSPTVGISGLQAGEDVNATLVVVVIAAATDCFDGTCNATFSLAQRVMRSTVVGITIGCILATARLFWFFYAALSVKNKDDSNPLRGS